MRNTLAALAALMFAGSASAQITVTGTGKVTYVPDLAHASLDLLIDGERGLWHLSNGGALTWAEFARRAAAGAGLGTGRVCGRPAKSFGWSAPRNVLPACLGDSSRTGGTGPARGDRRWSAFACGDRTG